MKLTRDVATVAELRAFLAACDVMEVAQDARVFARTGFSMSASDGMPVKRLTVETTDAPNTTREVR